MSGHPRRRPRILLPDLRKNHCGAPDRLLIGPGVRKRALDPLEAPNLRIAAPESGTRINTRPWNENIFPSI